MSRVVRLMFETEGISINQVFNAVTKRMT